MIDQETRNNTVEVIEDWFQNEGFKARKLTDTPTDDLQVVNKKYADDILPAPGTSGNVLTSDGTDWTSTASSSPTATTIVPVAIDPIRPAATVAGQNKQLNVNTAFYAGMVIVPFQITANNISILVNNINVNGTYDLTLYSEDGQTQIFAITTGTISVAGVVTTALSAVVIPPGVYYIGINSNGTANMNVVFWDTVNIGLGTGTGYLGDSVVGKAVTEGTFTITAGTPPTTFLPYTDILYAVSDTLMFRLDT